MTEAEWLAATDPTPMLDFLRGRTSDRKFRLFIVGCNGLASRFGGYEQNAEAIAVAERYADGLATRDELRAVHDELDRSPDTLSTTACFATVPEVGGYVRKAVSVTIWRAVDYVDEQSPGFEVVEEREERSLVRLLRDIFGNPFQPGTADPAWLTSTVRLLAEGIYSDRAFDRMPILADALQDAGCDNDDILNHCRGDGPHVRGCWAVDLLLGKGRTMTVAESRT